MSTPTALTIAGSDPSGGAGLQADLATFVDHGVYGMAVPTALTAQNTRGVVDVWPVPPAFLRLQLEVLFADMRVDAVKIGMLHGVDEVHVVADVLAALHPRPPIVLDPVLLAKGGRALLSPDGVEALRARLLPLVTLVTPNLPEAAVLGRDLPVAALVKGGHGGTDPVVDVLHQPGRPPVRYPHRRIEVDGRRWEPRGTGCVLASAIAARLACGASLPDACEGAITYVSGLIARSVHEVQPGGGSPVLRHGGAER